MSLARRIVASLVVSAVAIFVVANTMVDKFSATSPEIPAHVWPSHPRVEISIAMRDIAKAARAGNPAPKESLMTLEDAAGRDALAPEPFLAHGVAAQLAGKTTNTEELFKAAKLRDPRSLPARYFLSGLYLHEGDIRRGLEEVAQFAGMSNGLVAVGPYIAAIARKRSTWPELRASFRDDPAIEQAALVALAADPANADTVIALQGKRRKITEAPWINVLVNALVNHRDYSRARAIFAAAAILRQLAGGLVFDPDFNQPEPPAPFNWTLASSTVGLAERQDRGRLHVIFYGQEDGVLANQLLVLCPVPIACRWPFRAAIRHWRRCVESALRQ